MISIPKHLSSVLTRAAVRAMPELKEPMTVTPDKDKDWDYNSPSAMKIFNMTKKQGSFGFATCQDMAKAIVDNLPDNEAIKEISLAQIGKGDPAKSGYFLNIFLRDQFVEAQIKRIQQCSGGVPLLKEEEEKDMPAKKVIIDFSSPNIAKNMHVGHLRSTIQGDAMCRVFEYLGWDVDRTNHVGDWGTQFGMLITELFDKYPDFTTNKDLQVGDLQTFYQNSKKRFDGEEEFKQRAKATVVKLQSGDEATLDGWKFLCDLSRKEFDQIYNRLDIKIKEVGESFYNPMLPGLLEDLDKKGIMKEDQGAKCVFVPKQKIPLMIQKSDGGFNYDTTDMAAINYRINELKNDRLIYITDAGQEFHFKLVFAGAQLAGYWDPKKTKVDHMPFGLVMQEAKDADGNPVLDDKGKVKLEKIKTRSGDSVKLMELLDEAKSRAKESFQQRLAESEGKVQMEEGKMDEAAEILGISSIKYVDLKQNRINNYAFSYEKMLDPKGNTGVYLIYQYVRVCSIIQKCEDEEAKVEEAKDGEPVLTEFKITNHAERNLATILLKLPEALDLCVNELAVNRITDLLYEIATVVGQFYHECKVKGSPEQASRVQLLKATKAVMEQLFHLLGMKYINKI